MYIYILSTGNC